MTGAGTALRHPLAFLRLWRAFRQAERARRVVARQTAAAEALAAGDVDNRLEAEARSGLVVAIAKLDLEAGARLRFGSGVELRLGEDVRAGDPLTVDKRTGLAVRWAGR